MWHQISDVLLSFCGEPCYDDGNQLIELYNYVTGVDGYISGGREGRPTSAAYRRFDDLNADWSAVRGRYQSILANELQRFNEAVERLGLPAIVLTSDGRLIS